MLGNELLTGTAVYLTNPIVADADCLTTVLKDFGVVGSLASADLTTVSYFQEHIEPLAFRFAVRRTSDDVVIGLCGLGDVQWQARHAQLTLMFSVRSLWMNGFADDVLETITRYAFMEVNLRRLALFVPETHPGLSAFASAGWRVEGRLRQALYLDGRFYDKLLIGLLRYEDPNYASDQ